MKCTEIWKLRGFALQTLQSLPTLGESSRKVDFRMHEWKETDRGESTHLRRELDLFIKCQLFSAHCCHSALWKVSLVPCRAAFPRQQIESPEN